VTVLLAAMFMGAFAGMADAQQQVPLSEYISRLSATVGRLQAIPAGGASETTIAEALLPLGLPLQVEIPSVGSVTVTQETLIGDPATLSLETVTARMSGALASARDVETATPPDAAALASALDQAYLGQTPVGPSLAQRVLLDIAQALGWLFDHTVGAMAGSGIGAVIAWLLLVGLLVLAGIFVRRVRGVTVSEGRLRLPATFVSEMDWRRAADAAIAAGDIAEAVRALYHLLLATLAARGVVHDAPSLTAGECRRAVRRQRPALAPAVDAATLSFERVVFGKVPAVHRDVEILQAAERAVKSA
jgi:hypothetical protein